MSDMREAGKKKMETQLPHLWNPHKIRQDDLFRVRTERVTVQEEQMECNVLELVDNFGFLISFFFDKFIC